jgi:hypothetical protein
VQRSLNNDGVKETTTVQQISVISLVLLPAGIPSALSNPHHLRIHGGVVLKMGGALLLKRYARPSIEIVVDLP